MREALKWFLVALYASNVIGNLVAVHRSEHTRTIKPGMAAISAVVGTLLTVAIWIWI